jgi:cytochrome c oxidase subunit 3
MLTTFSDPVDEIELKEPGGGGRPPVDERPTGGGGGGGDDDWNMDGHGPRQLLYRFRRILFTVLAVDVLFFTVATSVYLGHLSAVHSLQHLSAPSMGWHSVFLPRIFYLNTVTLALGSLTIELARRNIFREIDVMEEWLGLGFPALRRTLPWIGATLFFAALFLTGQKMAWKQLATEGFPFDPSGSSAGYFAYLTTGIHAAHFAIGVVALIFCLTALGWLKRIELRQIAVDTTAWYWHSMSAAWIVLLTLLASAKS